MDEVLSLKVLDPAMGSGHFLVEATEFLALALATDPYVETEAPAEEDLTHWRRRVVERCIYGVDKNPLAVELAKLSLWLATVAADRPLSFLDHHLKCGDSLVGARVADLGWSPPAVLSKRAQRQLEQQKAGQINMFEHLLSQRLPVMLGKVLEITEVESDSYDTVQAKEAADRAVEQLKAPFAAVANLWVSSYFGHEFTPGEYDEALGLIGQPGKLLALDAVAHAQRMADERDFFHWELSFPEVFYDYHGQPLHDAAGFDAVVGNPPYVRAEAADKQQRLYLMSANRYQTMWGRFDVFLPFIEGGVHLLREGGNLGMIVPSAVLTINYAEKLREWLLTEHTLLSVVDLRHVRVFEDAAVSTCVLTVSKQIASPDTETMILVGDRVGVLSIRGGIASRLFLQLPAYAIRPDLDPIEMGLRDHIDAQSISVGDLCFCTTGLVGHDSNTGASVDRLIHSTRISRDCQPYVEAKEWDGRYSMLRPERFIEYKPELMHRPKYRELFESPKILVQRLASGDWIQATLDRDGVYVNHVLNCCTKLEAVIHLGTRLNIDLTAARPNPDYSLDYILALMCSRLLGMYHNRFLSPGLDIFPETIRQLPIRRIEFTTPADERQRLVTQALALHTAGDHAALLAFVDDRLVAEPEQADVVHDLLVYLAEQMIAMNREKQAAIEAFWLDLEGVTEGDAFDVLRNKGKQERTLWRTPACRPHVSQDSAGTHTLDESLAWSEDAFKAFVKALAGEVEGFSKLVGVYRAHSPAYRELVARIAATDHLIDRIVYQLYDLDGDEIAIVEGQAE